MNTNNVIGCAENHAQTKDRSKLNIARLLFMVPLAALQTVCDEDCQTVIESTLMKVSFIIYNEDLDPGFGINPLPTRPPAEIDPNFDVDPVGGRSTTKLHKRTVSIGRPYLLQRIRKLYDAGTLEQDFRLFKKEGDRAPARFRYSLSF
jgi:hypothetical protein